MPWDEALRAIRAAGSKVGLMHDPTTSRDLRDNRRVLTKNLMALAKHYILGPNCVNM
jgi:hypothetical protein